MTSVSGPLYGVTPSSNQNSAQSPQTNFDSWFDDVLEGYSRQKAQQKADTYFASETPQDPNASDLQIDDTESTGSAEDDLLKWLTMSLAERLRAQYLADHDVTEEELEAMPTDERAKMEDAIAEYIKENMAQITGAQSQDVAGQVRAEPAML